MLHWSSTFTVFVITIVKLNSSASSHILSSFLCSPGWIYINISDKCITSSSSFGSKNDNLEFCKMLNASMITIESAEENVMIHDQLTKLNNLRFWITGETGPSVDGKTPQTIVNLMKSTNYTNWGNGSPSCQIKPCCIMVNSFKFWHDTDCYEELYFACEKRRIFELSEPTLIDATEEFSPKELECSEKVLLDVLAPVNKAKLDLTFAKIFNEIEINRANSKVISVTSSPKPSTVSSLNHTIPFSSSLVSTPSSLGLPTTESVTQYPPEPMMVTVSEELINHIIKRYQEDQLNVIKLWFELIRTYRNSSERSRQLQRSINKPTAEGFQLSNYLLVMLTVLSILVLVATIIALSIITRRLLRQQTQDTYQLSSRLLELGYNAYE